MSGEEEIKKLTDGNPTTSNMEQAKCPPPSGKGAKKGGIRFPFLDKFRKSSQERKDIQRRRSSAGTGDDDVPCKKSGGHLNVEHEPHSTPTF